MIYIGRVIEKDREYEDVVSVVLQGGSTIPHKCRVCKGRANPLYGESGNLPDIGEQGLIVYVEGYGDKYFWLCSIADLVENICTSEQGDSIEHLQNGMWKRIAANGDVEIYHPSGTFIKIGDSTVMSQRTRYKRKDGTVNLKSEVPYASLRTPNKNLYIKHGWGGNAGNTAYPTDKRKTDAGAPTHTTEFLMDTSGNVTLTHHTVNGDVVLTFDSQGNMVTTLPAEYRVVAQTIDLGDIRANLHRLVDERFMALYNAHTHSDPQGGNTGVPNASMDTTNHMTNITRAV